MYKYSLLVISLLLVSSVSFAISEKEFSSSWDSLLKSRVNSQGMVDYAAIKKSSGALNSFLKNVKALTKSEYDSWSRSRKLAFWINTYNAVTVQTIVDNYPISSIRKIWKVFSVKRIVIMGKNMSLNDMEHNTIRPIFKEPRIHFALVCAAISCPRLLNRAYSSGSLESQLELQSEYFGSRTKYFSVDPSTKTVYLSSIMKWYGKDFIKKFDSSSLDFSSASERASVNFLLKYDDKSWRALVLKGEYKVKYLKYNWALNKQ